MKMKKTLFLLVVGGTLYGVYWRIARGDIDLAAAGLDPRALVPEQALPWINPALQAIGLPPIQKEQDANAGYQPWQAAGTAPGQPNWQQPAAPGIYGAGGSSYAPGGQAAPSTAQSGAAGMLQTLTGQQGSPVNAAAEQLAGVRRTLNAR